MPHFVELGPRGCQGWKGRPAVCGDSRRVFASLSCRVSFASRFSARAVHLQLHDLRLSAAGLSAPRPRGEGLTAIPAGIEKSAESPALMTSTRVRHGPSALVRGEAPDPSFCSWSGFGS